MSDQLFKRENDVIAEIETLLGDDAADASRYRSELNRFLSEYRKLLRESRRLVRISDRNEEDLRQARMQAEAATRAKAAFLATMSHEIRTPMNGVIGMIDLMWQTELAENQREMLSTVRDSAFSLLTIINDILDSSKIEAGRLNLEAIAFSLRDIIEGVAESMAPNAGKKGLQMSAFTAPEIPDSLIGDPVRIRQIVMNLASNAVKFTDSGAVAEDEDRNRIIIRAEQVDTEGDTEDTASIRIDVVDRGIGMSQEVLGQLFTPFTQADSSTTRRFGGTGLGLSICKNLAEMMGGTISAESAEGAGSTFSVAIPLGLDPEFDPTGKARPFAGYHALVIAQDAFTRSTVGRYLEARGAATEETDNLPDAEFQLLSEGIGGNPFDVIVIGDSWLDAALDALFDRLNSQADYPVPKAVILSASPGGAFEHASSEIRTVRAAPVKRAGLLNTVAEVLGLDPVERQFLAEVEIAPTGDLPTVEEAEAQGRLVLVAEDNATNRDIIGRQLTLLGVACVIVDDGAEALTALEERDYGMVLTDCHMPNVDGYELTRRIRTNEEKGEGCMPVVAITASALESDAELCRQAGMDGYLTKPLELPKLKAALEEWLPPAPNDGTSADTELALAGVEPSEDGAMETAPGPIDPSALTNPVGDDPEMHREILKDFLVPASEIVGEVNRGFDEESPESVAKAAHKLKSAARSIGANALADLCLTLESAGKNGDWPTIVTTVPELNAESTVVLDYISAL